jgi:hypothetical protein
LSLSRQSITDPITHTKTATSQDPVFTESSEQRTENPRVENLVITPVNTHPEGSDLIGAFLCLTVLRRGDIPVFLTSYYRQWLEKYVNTFGFLFVSRTGEDQ